jgi:hypothetical protein
MRRIEVIAMTTKRILITTFILALLLTFASCARHDVSDPSPVGPSTFATVLKVSASPNVIMASAERDETMITASLRKYDGTPLAGRTIIFEIGDAARNKIALGFFQGNEYVKSVVTDSSGQAVVKYYGPSWAELATNATVYIWASVALEGSEFISDFSMVDVIGDPSTLYFKVVADPDVLSASAKRSTSDLTATVLYGAKPIVNKKVYFSILSNYPGYLTGHKRSTSVATGTDGVARLQYFGPTKDEISRDIGIVIRGQLETSTTIPPENMILEEIYIRIIRQ